MSPAATMYCDCGWSFIPELAPSQARSDREQRSQERQAHGKQQLWSGVLLLIVGVAVTALTFGAASGGGHYILAYGPIIGGVARIFQGIATMQR